MSRKLRKARRLLLNPAATLLALFAGVGVSTCLAQIPLRNEIEKRETLMQAIAESEKLLAQYPNSDFTPTLMFQLGELYLRRAALQFQSAMSIYEEQEKQYADGTLKEQPVPPQVDFSDAIDVLQRLLEHYPNIHFRDKVLYRIALCYQQQGQNDQASVYFKQLSEATTDKALLEEADFRLGEYFFEQKEYASAIEHYKHLLTSWDSPYFDMALYKLGWSYYNIEDYTNAITIMLDLIEDVNLLEHAKANELGKTGTDLRQEAIEYVAISLAESGGPPKAREVLQSRKDSDYAEKILVHLADLYRERNFYHEAVAILRLLIEFYPLKPEAPKYQKKIVENYELAGEKQEADKARDVLIAQYGPGSPWLEMLTDSTARRETLAMVEEALYILGTEAQARAQQTHDPGEYARAIGKYRIYLAKFPHVPRAHKVQFYLGECLYESGRYAEAAKAYYGLMLNYPDSQFAEMAAYHRILAYNQILQESSAHDTTDFFMLNFLGSDSSQVHILRTPSSIQAQLMQACNDFSLYNSDSDHLPEVLMTFGDLLYEIAEYDMARKVFQRLLDNPFSQRFRPQATIMVAQCEFKMRAYPEAETWGRKVIQLFPDSVRFVRRAKKLISSAKFQHAEMFLEQGDTTRAAEAFTRVGKTAPDTSVAIQAFLEAATRYQQIDQREKAVEVYRALAARFPTIKQAPESLFKAGLLLEDLEDWRRAADAYLELYTTWPR
ncbi:MAG: hypothetical protein D6743_03490, partial [Calditrichaeota bacterium]